VQPCCVCVDPVSLCDQNYIIQLKVTCRSTTSACKRGTHKAKADLQSRPSARQAPQQHEAKILCTLLSFTAQCSSSGIVGDEQQSHLKASAGGDRLAAQMMVCKAVNVSAHAHCAACDLDAPRISKGSQNVSMYAVMYARQLPLLQGSSFSPWKPRDSHLRSIG
jgi:hypothetical protein